MVVGAIIGAAVGLYGAHKSSQAAKDAVRTQNEQTERQYEYDLELYKLNQQKITADRQHAAENILLQAQNERKVADFKDASNLRNYQYNLQIRNREQDTLNQQYVKSDVLYNDQITLNTLAEKSAFDSEHRKVEDIRAEAAFDAEEANIKQILNEGKFRARGMKGKTADKAAQVTYADLGIALSRINESEANANRMSRAVMEEISQDRISADLAAFASKMLPPGTLPMPLTPLATPTADWQLPRALGEYDFGPEPIKGAYASPSAAANQVWGTAISSIAGNVGSAIDTFNANR